MINLKELNKYIPYNHFEMQGLVYEDLSADISDLGHIENQRGIKVLGLLGLSFFKSFIFELNTRDLQLTLHKNRQTLVVKEKLLFKAPLRMEDDVIWIQARLHLD